MASSFSTNLGVEIMASGEKSGTWGDVTNFNLNIVDRLVSFGEITASDTTTDLTIRVASPTSGSSNVQTFGDITDVLVQGSGSNVDVEYYIACTQENINVTQ